MIYSRFGTQLTLLSKQLQAGGRLLVQANAVGSANVREYPADELKADEGSAEIDAAVAALPWMVLPKKVKRPV